MSLRLKLIDNFWLGAAATLLATVWLLPNHYPPWMSFHSDAATAVILAVIAACILWRAPKYLDWHWAPIVAGCVATLPWLQYAFGLIPFAGTAWINSAYLLAFVLALLVGAHWEKLDRGQCADFLFVAICIAAISSVAMQFHQWLQLDGMDLWIMRVSGPRKSANMGQPNQLATLLVLGLLACGWGVLHKKIGRGVGSLLSCYLLFGIALTQSRTAWLNIALIMLAMFLWGWLRSQRSWILGSSLLALFFMASVTGMPTLSEALQVDGEYGLSERLDVGVRPVIWHMFAEAALQKPFFGFGWGQIVFAHLQAAADQPFLGAIFYQSHNLFLDLILANGLPIGIFLTGALCWWFLRVALAVREESDLVLLLFVLVLGVHAMLEFPLHYAYFLLPIGLVMGMLNVRTKFSSIFLTTHWMGIGILIVCGVMLSVTVRDYLRAEESFYALRFEKARVQMAQTMGPPNVLVLTQLRDLIVFARMDASAGLDDKEIAWMQNITLTYPSPYNVYKLATTLALNGKSDDAQRWLRTLCKAFPFEHCQVLKDDWLHKSIRDPAISSVPWPSTDN